MKRIVIIIMVLGITMLSFAADIEEIFKLTEILFQKFYFFDKYSQICYNYYVR